MEILEEKIKSLQNYRDLFFINNPTIPYDEFLKEIKKKVCNLKEEIPISIKDVKNITATNFYIQGKILNIMPEYDENCENYLTKAVKKECTKWESWLELAICMWKKGNYEGALECMKEAYKLNNNNCDILIEYGTVLRNQKKPELNELARKLCLKGIEIYPNNPMIWYSYANQCLHDFYNYDKDIQYLEKSIECFNKSLSLTTPTTPLPSDFYLNFSSSHYSNGNLVECCLNLTKAVILEPYYQVIHEKISCLDNLLKKIFQKYKEIAGDEGVNETYLNDTDTCTENLMSENNGESYVKLIHILNSSNNISSYYIGTIEKMKKIIVICDAKNLLIIDMSMRYSLKNNELVTGDDNNIICDIKLPLSRLKSKMKNSFDVNCQKQKDNFFDNELLFNKTKKLFPNIHILDCIPIFCYY
ncbi:Tetratricopeptide repeat protein 5 [Strongyloides ratti]|uniref:Tetratricopeptide repeat protein 5 n=1 Tax=Strongyloides ratti TaxID=34506 RepID=A0A090L7F1_STRRB|nr:Tetratricopeptide repeat protein 5 [Strongyloides ratti]CEF64063.1 Tetratricopeptide repeat protein 5 [Strongyloides ratti]